MSRRRTYNKRVVGSESGKYMLACIAGGSLHLSKDYGVTWNELTNAGITGLYDAAISPDGRFVVAVGYGGYISISRDSGETWTKKGEVRSWSCVGMSSDGRYITVGINGGALSISSDYGDTFSEYGYYIPKQISLSASGEHQIVAAATGVIVSSNFGATWTVIQKQAAEGAAVSGDGKTMVVLTPKKNMHISRDYGVTWNEVISIGEQPWRKASISENGDVITATLEAASSYYPDLYKSKDNGEAWVSVITGSGGLNAIDISASGDIMLGATNKAYGDLCISRDNGNKWEKIQGMSSKYWKSVAINK